MSENDRPLVYVVILTYEMREVARRCLASLQQLTYPNYRLVVVDNGSQDGTEQAIREGFSQIKVIQTGENLGYTGGNNRGIEYAISQDAAYVLVLNPDTVLANPDFLDEMVNYVEANPEIGIAGPRVFLREVGVVQNTVLFPPGLWRNIANWFWYRLRPSSFEYSQGKVVDAQVLNGVCLLLRTACLQRIGLFDENMFMYIEDAEMDYRAWRDGWRVIYLPIDSVIHEQKRSGYDMTSQPSFFLRRNSVYYLCKIGKRAEAFGYAFLSLFLLAVRGILTFDREGIKKYMAFCWKLLVAYWTIFSDVRCEVSARVIA